MLMKPLDACRGPRSMAATHGMRTIEQNGHAPGHGSAQKQLSQVGHHVLGSPELERVQQLRRHTVALHIVDWTCGQGQSKIT